MASIKHKAKPAVVSVSVAQGTAGRKGWLNWTILLPKVMLGACNAMLGLMVAVIFFSYGDEKIVAIVALQSKCQGFSDSHSVAKERSSLYAFCIRQGIHFSRSTTLAQLR
jgi:hypothetical protein